jgi:hypothetical protein
MSSMHRYVRAPRAVLLASLVLLVAGCSSPAPKPDPRPPDDGKQHHKMVNPLALTSDDDHDGMQVEGTLGTIDDEAIQSGLSPRMAEASACFKGRTQRHPYLGGKLTLHFRVGRNGSSKKVKIAENGLGSLDIERCILRVFGGATFGRPKGGEAEFTYPLIFPSRVPTLHWESGMVKDEMLKRVDELLRGANGKLLSAPAGLVVTFYVGPRGRVASVGLMADDVVDEGFGDRFVENLKQLKFIPPQGGYAKVSYAW